MFYSKMTGGFYDIEIHGDSIPSDAVEITSEEHAALMVAQEGGKVIVADANGKPEAITYVSTQPAPIPPITTRQFLIAAMGAGFISAEEAIAASTSGAVPASIAASFAELSLAEQVEAQITWAKMTVIDRHEPLVIAAAAQLGLNDEQVDAFFLQAATI